MKQYTVVREDFTEEQLYSIYLFCSNDSDDWAQRLLERIANEPMRRLIITDLENGKFAYHLRRYTYYKEGIYNTRLTWSIFKNLKLKKLTRG